jgi:hypothetical protein
MASKKSSKAYTLRMTKQAQKPAKNNKPSQSKTEPNYTFGGNFATGRQIKTQPETRKKPSLSSRAAGASKEKRTPGLRVRGMDSAGPVVRAGVGQKPKNAKKNKVTGQGVASKGQAMRNADAASAAKRRKSGTTRGSRGMY